MTLAAVRARAIDRYPLPAPVLRQTSGCTLLLLTGYLTTGQTDGHRTVTQASLEGNRHGQCRGVGTILTECDVLIVCRQHNDKEWKFKEQHAKMWENIAGARHSRPRGFNIAGVSALSFRRLWANE